MRYLLIALLFISCNKDKCHECYTVTYKDGKQVSKDFVKKQCLLRGQQWNPTFQSPPPVNGTNYECE